MTNPKPYYVLNGSGGADQDWDDYAFLKKLAKNGKTFSGWGCTSSVQKDDSVFFYVSKPVSAIVAQGVALKNAWKKTPKDHWRYNTKIGRVRLLAEPITIREIKVLFPTWSKWHRAQGQGWAIPDEFVKRLIARADLVKANSEPTTLDKKGAGFGTPESNRKVEIAAIKAVTKDFENSGWKVASVEKENRGYDLLATKEGKEAHIEVKGVKGSKPEFVITQNELYCAKADGAFSLIVVTGALTPKSQRIHRFSGKDLLSNYDLKPVSFFAREK